MTVLSNSSSASILGRSPATDLRAHAASADLPAPPPQLLSPLQYTLLLLILPLLAIPGCIALGRSDFFLHHGASAWVRANDSIFDMHGRNCDLIVFGDSTAMTGLDPDQISRDTGLHACNIAVTNAVLAVTSNLTLDRYLEHNHTPRVLLFQLSPDDFQRAESPWERTIYAEGLLELLRHGTPAEIRRTLLEHPRESVAFAGYVAGYTSYYFIRSAWSRWTGEPLEEDRITIHNGFFTPPAAARTFCNPAEERADPGDRRLPAALVASVQHQYAARIPTVLVNVAPIPACDENLPAFRAQLAGLTSNSLAGLPITLFNDDRHYTATGARVVSGLVVSQLRQVNATTDLLPQNARLAGSTAMPASLQLP